MKKLFLIALAVTTLTSYAQKQQGFKNQSSLSTEQKAVLQTKRMTLALDLDKKQQEQILALNKTKIEKRKQKRELAQKRRNSSQKPTGDEVFNRKQQRLDNRIAHSKELKLILTEKQYEKWEAKRAKNNHKKMNNHRKMNKRRKGNKRQ